MRFTISAAALFAAFSMQSGSAQSLTARQLFYQAEAEAKPPAPQTPPPAATKRTVRKKSTVAAAGAASPSSAPESAERASTATAVPVTSAAYVTPAPLGLRYSLARVTGGTESEVSPKSVFHSGDMVRVQVEGNRDGYLYVIARGSSGTWKPLFPAPDIQADNHIAARRKYSLPSGTQAFTFDEQAGEEQLFIVFSAQPVADIDGLIPTLPQSPRPAGLGQEVLAMNRPITDGFVSGLRQTYSRDLLVQTVEQSQPAAAAEGDAKPENAVYVVNGSGGRLVADIRLEHR